MADTIKWVDVVDAEGAPVAGFENPVPSHWVGTDLLPAGTKAKGRARSAAKVAEEDAEKAPDTEPTPAGSAS